VEVIRVRAIHTFPTSGKPGVGHDVVRVTTTGLEGDRPKKAAVSLIGNDAPTVRANLVLDVPTQAVEALDGHELRVGDVVLGVHRTGNSCAGLYAAVGKGGSLHVGDAVEVR
jgi:uncharacterized protein YcbX